MDKKGKIRVADHRILDGTTDRFLILKADEQYEICAHEPEKRQEFIFMREREVFFLKNSY